MKFDHTQEHLNASLGISEKQIESLKDTMTDIANRINNDKLKPSEAAEIIVNTLSYSDLVYIAVQFIVNKIEQAELANKVEFMKALLEIIKDDE